MKRFLVRVWLLICLFLLSSPAVHAQSTASPIIGPSNASLLLINRWYPPPDSAGWTPVSLPDNWAHRGFRPEPSPVWYRLEFDVPADFQSEGPWAAYLRYLYDGGQLFLNEKPFALVPETDAVMQVKWERPHLLALPTQPDSVAFGNGLTVGRNVIHVRLTAPPPGRAVKMPEILLGPSQALRPIYESRLFVIHTVPQFTATACAAAAILVLFIWWRRRSEVLYGIFGVSALLWGVRTLTFVIEQLPHAQWALWRICYQSATGGFVVLMALFTLRTAGLHRPNLERGLIAYGLMGPILLAWWGSAADEWVSLVWYGGFLFVGVMIIGSVGLAAWRQRTATAIALMVSMIVAVLAATHDYFLLVSAPWFARLFPEWHEHRLYLLQYAANAVLLVMGTILANRFINALRDLESLNQTLDCRVAEREAVIEQNYQRLADLEGQRQGAEERQRIMQDMHDGLGAQLFSSLSRSERADMSQQEMSDALRGCIAEMRLAIDSLSTSEDDFEATFSDFRYRWEPQLKALGIESRWHVDIAPGMPQLAPHNSLQVLRILQEALTNVLKHSRAKNVQVRLTWADALLQAEVEDDGVGVLEATRAHSRGLHNMRTRAGRLGGELRLESIPGQTVLKLSVPIAS